MLPMSTNHEMRKKLNNLITLTDSAIVHADKKNIAAVCSCIYKRRYILECFSLSVTGSVDESTLKDSFESLVKKDKELKDKLLSLKKSLVKEKDKFSNKRKMRTRFVGERSLRPRFIDKKV